MNSEVILNQLGCMGDLKRFDRARFNLNVFKGQSDLLAGKPKLVVTGPEMRLEEIIDLFKEPSRAVHRG